MHKVGLNAWGYLNVTPMPRSQLSGNSVLVHMSYGNTKPLDHIKSCANVDGWSVGQTFSTGQESSHHILKTYT